MKSRGATTPLINLLNAAASAPSATGMAECDLYSFTTNGGSVINFSGAMVPVTFSPTTWALGPTFERGKLQTKLGVEVATVDVTINSGNAAPDLINGVPWTQFVLGLGLDNASVVIYRAYFSAAQWAALPPLVPTGTLIAFSGRVTQIKDISATSMTMTVSSWMVLANVNMGPDIFQAPCLNTVYDGACLASRPSFTFNGTVASGGGGPTILGFNTNLTQADDYFTQGALTFTSGANNGLERAVKLYRNASGALQLVLPLPAAPTVGDTFSISAGCDLTMTTCTNRFNNLIHFRGQPFTPPPVIQISGM